MATLCAQTIHPFVFTDILDIDRGVQHTDASWLLMERLREHVRIAEQLGMIAAYDSSSKAPQYEISRAQTVKIRQAYLAQTGDTSTKLHIRKQQDATTALCHTLNRLVYLGLITAIPKVGDTLDRDPWVRSENAYPLALSLWLNISTDAKGYAGGYGHWTPGQPNCFTAHIPAARESSAQLALAAVNVFDDICTMHAAPTYSPLARALVEARHVFSKETNEMLVVRELDRSNADCVLVDTGRAHPVSMPADRLYELLAETSQNAISTVGAQKAS